MSLGSGSEVVYGGVVLESPGCMGRVGFFGGVRAGMVLRVCVCGWVCGWLEVHVGMLREWSVWLA